MQATQDKTQVLNALLRGELAATETYQQAMAKVGNEPGAADLTRIRDEHREAAKVSKALRDLSSHRRGSARNDWSGRAHHQKRGWHPGGSPPRR